MCFFRFSANNTFFISSASSIAAGSMHDASVKTLPDTIHADSIFSTGKSVCNYNFSSSTTARTSVDPVDLVDTVDGTRYTVRHVHNVHNVHNVHSVRQWTRFLRSGFDFSRHENYIPETI